MTNSTPGNAPAVLVTARFFDSAAADFLRAQGFTVRQPALNNTDPAPETLPSLLDGMDAWIVGGTDVTGALMAAFPRLQLVSRRGVGYEQIDLEAATALGRVVTIAAGGNAPSVADHAVGLMLSVGKNIPGLMAGMRGGDWTFGMGSELNNKTVGIIGLGRIGKLVARRLRGFDATLLATDIVPDEAFAAANGVRLVDLPTLLTASDVVTLHVPLTKLTRDLINAETLASMKPGAILINTARGGLVDEAALLDALQSGRLAGAGLDVFKAEKDKTLRAAAHALIALPNVVATPHSAAATRESLTRSNLLVANTVIAVLAGKPPPPGCIVADGRPGAG